MLVIKIIIKKEEKVFIKLKINKKDEQQEQQ